MQTQAILDMESHHIGTMSAVGSLTCTEMVECMSKFINLGLKSPFCGGGEGFSRNPRIVIFSSEKPGISLYNSVNSLFEKASGFGRSSKAFCEDGN